MNISKVIRFLVTGVVIGAILFFAGFGLLNLLEKDREITAAVDAPAVSEAPATSETVPVDPPTIEITPNQATTGAESSVQTTNTTQGEGTSSSPIKIKPLNSVGSESSSDTSEATPAVAFGTLKLSTVNSIDNQPTNADFLIENSDNVAIARVKDTSTSTLSLPVGDYKITVSQGSQKVIRFLGVKENQNGSETFELYVPVLTGEPAAAVVVGSDKPVAIIKPKPTPKPATKKPSKEVARSPSANPEPAQTVEPSTLSFPSTPTPTVTSTSDDTQAPTGSAASKSTSTSAMGGLRLSALTKQGKRPTVASFHIQRLNGQEVKTLIDVKSQQLTLPAGKYRVMAKTGNATVAREVEVLAMKGLHEIFLIPEPSKISQQVTQPAVQKEEARSTEPSTQNKATGKLELFAQKAVDGSPLKSNFYVQMPNGTMVTSNVYVESIGYKLPASKYKVIVRATGYKDRSVMLMVRKGQTRREVFKLDPINQTGSNTTNNTNFEPPASVTKVPLNPIVRPAQAPAIAYGGLTVNIVSASTGAQIPADIVITQRDGTPLKQVMGVASASFDLPPREFLIRVTYDGFTSSHQVNIVAGKLAIKKISFDTQRMSRRERRQQRRERRERSQ